MLDKLEFIEKGDNKMKEKNIAQKPLIISIFFFVCSFMFLIFFIVTVGYYNLSKTSYDDLIYKEYTVEKITEDEDPEMGSTYYITVLEDEKVLKINNLFDKANVRNGLNTLSNGTKIYCYLIDDNSIYNVVEIKTPTTIILSLDEYNKIYYLNGLIGIIIMPFIFMICCVGGVSYLIVYFKKR